MKLEVQCVMCQFKATEYLLAIPDCEFILFTTNLALINFKAKYPAFINTYEHTQAIYIVHYVLRNMLFLSSLNSFVLQFLF